MPSPIDILTHTPPYVFALFALLVVLGIIALRPRRQAAWRPIVLPVVFMAWGALSLAGTADATRIALWLALAIPGAILARIAWPRAGVRFDAATGLVVLTGSVVPLIRNLTIFAIKYALGVATAIGAGIGGAGQAAPLANAAVSGLLAGYFVSWLACYLAARRRALA